MKGYTPCTYIEWRYSIVFLMLAILKNEWDSFFYAYFVTYQRQLQVCIPFIFMKLIYKWKTIDRSPVTTIDIWKSIYVVPFLGSVFNILPIVVPVPRSIHEDLSIVIPFLSMRILLHTNDNLKCIYTFIFMNLIDTCNTIDSRPVSTINTQRSIDCNPISTINICNTIDCSPILTILGCCTHVAWFVYNFKKNFLFITNGYPVPKDPCTHAH